VPDAALSQDAGVLTVTFDRQDKLNAVSDEMLAVLTEAVDQLRDDDEARVLVIEAVGRYFTAGVDLDGDLSRQMDERATRPYPDQYFRRVYRSLHLLFDELEAIEKPTILAAQGPCFGIGVELAVVCDFRFASDAATFALPEIKIGVIPGSGGTGRLTRLIGPHWAKWLTVAGQTVDADLARTIGLVHEVVPGDGLATRVAAFAAELTALPAEALGIAKIAVDISADVPPKPKYRAQKHPP
jgi:enoyl-CoA hydratase/carnithine racemase